MVHFSELRHRLVKILLSFIIAVIIVYISSFWWMTLVISYITRAHVTLHAFSFTEMIQIYVMIIFFIAFCLISPIMFYQLWAFVAPGLHDNERQFIYKYSLFSVLLFSFGVAFAFYIGFPMIIQFALKLSSTLNISPVIGFKAYLVELIRWLFTFGILFQLPILFVGLAKFGLIDIASLKHYRKYIYFACFVLASIIAPPDITLNILLALPLILLFEFSMFIVKFTCRAEPPTH
ncbi:twin-arginine translocase subunit TatC [Staphylococcus argenteus]|uniref:twin-arginine translocase subunit TatC n=1 Tax=Staphylococcus argenteus TaxID=985002 RepID=UPI001EFEABDD|nr:twin-arginine translocase subunit TatC [Staphylococcus argenteus]MCG9803351.1 twin-arginine translocase subunit TatC [Staphylococcus argenteus]MCG9810084.1 twin-arginine translocase subunit TatC [Staphylococcus argenteus]MCG9824207.1 twin-arginine translocase subunit TatC [Staphylococcus argenteus]